MSSLSRRQSCYNEDGSTVEKLFFSLPLLEHKIVLFLTIVVYFSHTPQPKDPKEHVLIQSDEVKVEE